MDRLKLYIRNFVSDFDMMNYLGFNNINYDIIDLYKPYYTLNKNNVIFMNNRGNRVNPDEIDGIYNVNGLDEIEDIDSLGLSLIRGKYTLFTYKNESSVYKIDGNFYGSSMNYYPEIRNEYNNGIGSVGVRNTDVDLFNKRRDNMDMRYNINDIVNPYIPISINKVNDIRFNIDDYDKTLNSMIKLIENKTDNDKDIDKHKHKQYIEGLKSIINGINSNGEYYNKKYSNKDGMYSWYSQVKLIYMIQNTDYFILEAATGFGKTAYTPQLVYHNYLAGNHIPNEYLIYKNMFQDRYVDIPMFSPPKIVASLPRKNIVESTFDRTINLNHTPIINSFYIKDERELESNSFLNFQILTENRKSSKEKYHPYLRFQTNYYTIKTFMEYPLNVNIKQAMINRKIINGEKIEMDKTEKVDNVVKDLLLINKNNTTIRNRFDFLLLDEIHEHMLDMDFIITVLKHILFFNKLVMGSGNFKFSLITATITDYEREKLKEYFYKVNNFNNFISLPRDNKEKKIDVYFGNRDKPSNSVEIKSRGINDNLMSKRIHKATDDLNELLNTGNLKGDILFFIPSKEKIRQLVKKYSDIVKYKKSVIFLPYYSNDRLTKLRDYIEKPIEKWDKKSINMDNLQKYIIGNRNIDEEFSNVFKKGNEYKYKVIFATDIAEASITIDNLYYVFDIGQKTHVLYFPEYDSSGAVKLDITKSSMTQRKGRVGRTKDDGEVYQFYKTENLFPIEFFTAYKTSNIMEHFMKYMVYVCTLYYEFLINCKNDLFSDYEKKLGEEYMRENFGIDNFEMGDDFYFLMPESIDSVFFKNMCYYETNVDLKTYIQKLYMLKLIIKRGDRYYFNFIKTLSLLQIIEYYEFKINKYELNLKFALLVMDFGLTDMIQDIYIILIELMSEKVNLSIFDKVLKDEIIHSDLFNLYLEKMDDFEGDIQAIRFIMNKKSIYLKDEFNKSIKKKRDIFEKKIEEDDDQFIQFITFCKDNKIDIDANEYNYKLGLSEDEIYSFIYGTNIIRDKKYNNKDFYISKKLERLTVRQFVMTFRKYRGRVNSRIFRKMIKNFLYDTFLTTNIENLQVIKIDLIGLNKLDDNDERNNLYKRLKNNPNLDEFKKYIINFEGTIIQRYKYISLFDRLSENVY